jgi:hypothetical protein
MDYSPRTRCPITKRSPRKTRSVYLRQRNRVKPPLSAAISAKA